MNEKMTDYADEFRKIQDRVSKIVGDEPFVDEVYTKGNVRNTLRIFPITIDQSAISGPPISVLEGVAKGSMQFNMNWTDFFKFTKIMTMVSKHRPGKIRILDVGCRHADLRPLGYRNRIEVEYHGIDINYSILSKCAQDFTNQDSYFYLQNLNEGIQLNKKYLASSGAGFDFIVLNDIVEHMDTKEKGLELINDSVKYLHDRGRLIITTPNSYEPGILQYPNDHFYEFSLDELKEHLDEIGLKVLNVWGTNIPERHIKNIPKDKLHLLDEDSMLAGIVGCRNAVMGLKLPEYSRHVFIECSKK